MRRLRFVNCMKALATTSSSFQRTQRRCTAASNGGSSSMPIAPPSSTTTTSTTPPQPAQTFPNGVASDIPRTPCAPSTATPIAPHKLHHSEMQVSVGSSASSSSADPGQSTAASSSLPSLGSPSKDEWLAKISRIVQLQSTHDMEWIDFSAHNLPKHSLLADGAFVSATRKMLVEHGVPLELVRKVTETVWLPLTHESSDGRAACFVMRASQLATEARIEQARAVRIAEALTRHTVVLQAGGKTNQRSQAQQEQQTSSSSPFPSVSNVENAAGGTILELSQRLNIFFVAANESEQQRAKLITVHRMPMQLIDDLQNQWTERHRFDRPEVLLYRIIRGCISSFKRTEEHHARHLEELSRMLFRGHRGVQPAEWSDSSEGEAVVRSNREFERAKTVTQRHGETRRQYFAASRSLGPGQDASSSSSSSFALIRRLAYSGVRRIRHLVVGGEPTANATLGERDMALVMRQLQGVNRQASANLRILREVQRAYNKMTSVMVREKVSSHHHLPTHGQRAGAPTATRRTKRTRERAKKRVRHLKRRLKKNDLQLIRRSNRTPTTNRFGTFGAVSIQRHHHHHHHHHHRSSSFLSKKYPHFHDHELALHLRTTIFQCEGLRDQSQSLLSLQVTIAASRLEELAGMLTVFSSFFIPLEFISGFFGTNFGAVLWFGTMPFGLPAVLLLMAGSAIATVRWVQKTTRVFGVRRP